MSSVQQQNAHGERDRERERRESMISGGGGGGGGSSESPLQIAENDEELAAEVSAEALLHTTDEINGDANQTAPLLTDYKDDIGCWTTPLPHSSVKFWVQRGVSTKLQHCDDETISKHSSVQQRTDRNSVRTCTTSLFKKQGKNKESVHRDWLCFSPFTGKLYCFYCKLFSSSKSNFANVGFDSWSVASERLRQHETSKEHMKASLTFVARRKEETSVNQVMARQEAEKLQYWRKVLKRVISTIKFIAERGLAFRGSDEKFGSPHNGNYLGILELIAQYDPFLQEHIKQHGNKGSGHTNLLSSTICEEVIGMMAEEVLKDIISRVKSSKYFSISVDSSPDDGHIDQLTITIRYIENNRPIERFLTFVPGVGHSGQQMADALLEFCQTHDVDFQDCRGQTYDNAANMSGKFNGMQAKLKEVNEAAMFIPCAAHSLNLVVKVAASACVKATDFFDLVQSIFVFFTSSTRRFSKLKETICSSQKKVLLPKGLSDTRWSCRADALRALKNGYVEIVDTLKFFASNEDEKSVVHVEAQGILKKMKSLEACIFIIFWADILERVNAVSKDLQNRELTISTCVQVLDSLKSYVEMKRDVYDSYETSARELTDEDYDHRRTRQQSKRRQPLDYGHTPAADLSPREKFRTASFLCVVDHILSAISSRSIAYKEVSDKFSVLTAQGDLSNEDIMKKSDILVKEYPEDLEETLGSEFVQLYAMAREIPGFEESVSRELFLYDLIKSNNLQSTFHNAEIALRIYLSLMVSNSTGERSFSKMKIIKNRLRTHMRNERLSALVLMSAESDILRSLKFDDIVDKFISIKNRRTIF